VELEAEREVGVDSDALLSLLYRLWFGQSMRCVMLIPNPLVQGLWAYVMRPDQDQQEICRKWTREDFIHKEGNGDVNRDRNNARKLGVRG
jgi:hypothetical protein